MSYNTSMLQRKAINMDPMQYTPVIVLCIPRDFENPKFKHKITTYRIKREDGRIYQIKEVRHCSKHRYGKLICFDMLFEPKMNTFSKSGSTVSPTLGDLPKNTLLMEYRSSTDFETTSDIPTIVLTPKRRLS